MKVKEYFHNIECDCCHELADEDYWHVDEEGVKEEANDKGWVKLGDNDYCPNCYIEDEETGITRTKDGKWWLGVSRTEASKNAALNVLKEHYHGEVPTEFTIDNPWIEKNK